MHHILKDLDSNRLKGLFIAYPESIQYLQSHHDVLLIDNTYSTTVEPLYKNSIGNQKSILISQVFLFKGDLLFWLQKL
jgi:hypothetical protein